MLLPVFLALLFSVIDIGVEFMTQVDLDHAAAVGARQIQIGNATSASTFVAAVCAKAPSFLITSCSSSLQVYVTSGSAFSGLTAGTVTSSGTLSPTTFSAGTAKSDLLVEVVYKRPYLFRLIGTLSGRSTAAVISVVAVQSEPY